MPICQQVYELINQSINPDCQFEYKLNSVESFTPTLQKSCMHICADKNHYYLSRQEAVSHILFTAEDQNPALFFSLKERNTLLHSHLWIKNKAEA